MISCEWVRSRKNRRAIGLDLDSATLAWGDRHNRLSLGSRSGNLELRLQDVRSVTRPRADVICAYNFSYFLVHPQAELVDYFRYVRRSLTPDGMFFLDAYGGWESQQVMSEKRRIDSPQGKFTYIWDQSSFNPIDNLTRCHIHFEFDNGERLKRAFTYHWRLYSPAEVCDALGEAGFSRARVFWDRSPDEDTEIYKPTKRAENTPGWLAYIVGEK
jgi:cyclopropane fatty-acyl-phospholipid synthase-like methyltransferase